MSLPPTPEQHHPLRIIAEQIQDGHLPMGKSLMALCSAFSAPSQTARLGKELRGA
jgi:hypothetical protein